MSWFIMIQKLLNCINRYNQQHGIRVHLTSPCYSSQQCPVCGSIHKENRKDQEHFECTECRHSQNADLNASINLRNRFTSDVLKSELHVQDEFNRLIPKKLKKEKIKEILLEYAWKSWLWLNYPFSKSGKPFKNQNDF